MAKRLLPGPRRQVVYIFSRDGARGGGHWMLVLECGHMVARRRFVSKPSPTKFAQAMFVPLEAKLAPQHAECFYCEAGKPKVDPAIMIKALGGPTL
jgi:hypothetical protein